MLRDKLKQWFSEGPVTLVPTTSSTIDNGRTSSAASAHVGVNEEKGVKRRRVQSDTAPVRHQFQNPNDGSGLSLIPTDVQNWQPILQYIGPDFGFDADIFTYEGEGFANQELNGELFNTIGWDTYMHGFGDRFNL